MSSALTIAPFLMLSWAWLRSKVWFIVQVEPASCMLTVPCDEESYPTVARSEVSVAPFLMFRVA